MTGHNVLPELFKTLPPARRALLCLIQKAAEDLGLSLYIVGGFVRDWLLGCPSPDYDLVVEGDARRLAHHLARTYRGHVRIHAPFLTAKWFLPPPEATDWQKALAAYDPSARPQDLPPFVDLVTARSETYPRPGALPQVRPASIYEDLARRDFTLNAMAVGLTGPHVGRLLDPFHGQDDLRAGLLRPLHPDAFVEDPTRITRAARYAARYGFRLHPAGLAQIPKALPVVPEVSGDRWRHELDLILQEDRAAEALRLLHSWGLFPAFPAPLPQDEDALGRVDRWQPPSEAWGLPVHWNGIPLVVLVRYALWWLETTPDVRKALRDWLTPPSTLWETVDAAARFWQERETWRHLSPGWLTLHLEKAPLPAVYALFLALEDAGLRERLAAFAARWRHIRAPIHGHDLRHLGLPPGPIYRDILEEVRVACIEGRVTSREAALDWVRRRWCGG